MHIITKKVTLLPASFVGTRIGIEITDEDLTWGMSSGSLAAESESVRIDWGDGTSETRAGISQLTHTYAAPGRYVVSLSDDLATLKVAVITKTSPFYAYAKRITAFFSNAQRLVELPTLAFVDASSLRTLDLSQSNIKTLGNNTFKGCTALQPELFFPSVTNPGGSTFKDCKQLTRIHFSDSNKAEITSLSSFQTDPTLGTGILDICWFDL